MKPRTVEALDIIRRVALLGDYDSNVAGMVAEVIAEEEFGMHKAKKGTRYIDGTRLIEGDSRTIQVKAWTEKRLKDWGNQTFLSLDLDNSADDLLLLLIYSSKMDYLILYGGPTSEVGHIGTLKGKMVRFVNFGGKNGLHLDEQTRIEIDLLLK